LVDKVTWWDAAISVGKAIERGFFGSLFLALNNF